MENEPVELSPDRYDRLHRALLAGLLGNAGVKGDAYEYSGAKNTKFQIFPGSGLFKAKPQWVVAAEVVETTKTYARTVARIRPEWIESLAPHLVKRSWTDPHWSEKTGHVVAYEKATLYGLTIVAKRLVHYGPIDPVYSRELFIRHALVDGELKTTGEFHRHNGVMLDEVAKLEAKLRRSNLLADVEVRYAFFDRLVPAEVYNAPLFERWRKEVEKTSPRVLFWSLAEVLKPEVPPPSPELFPDELRVGDLTMPIEYRFEPGSVDDGVTVRVPISSLNQLRDEPFEWLVPGYVEDKILALLRSLPKALRTRFVPAPDYAKAATATLTKIDHKLSLVDEFARFLGKQAGLPISRRDFDLADVPEYLRMNFAIVDTEGVTIDASRDLSELRKTLASRINSSLADVPTPEWHRDGLRNWDFDSLPEKVEVKRRGVTLVGYPALVDTGTTGSLRLLDTPAAASEATRHGVRRLFAVQCTKEMQDLWRRLPNFDQMSLYYAPLGSADFLRQQIVDAAAERAFYVGAPDVRAKSEFVKRAEDAWRKLNPVGRELCETVAACLTEFHAVSKLLSSKTPPMSLEDAVADMRRHLKRLMPANFVAVTPAEWLPHLPRFLKGIAVRFGKLYDAGLNRDEAAMRQIVPLQAKLDVRVSELAKRAAVEPAVTQFRWLLEELRVSLFAQELKTSQTVSVKRLTETWAQIR